MKSANAEYYRQTREVLSSLQISATTLRNYCKLLTEVAPDEFEHRRYETIYSPESYAALEKVRQLFLTGWSRQQVKDKLHKEGL